MDRDPRAHRADTGRFTISASGFPALSLFAPRPVTAAEAVFPGRVRDTVTVTVAAAESLPEPRPPTPDPGPRLPPDRFQSSSPRFRSLVFRFPFPMFFRLVLPMVLVSCLSGSLALAQSVTVTADRTSLALGESLRLRIVMQGRFEDARGPDIPDFDVIGKSTGTSISVIGGTVQQEQRVDLTLVPRRAGRLRIGPVELLSDGRVVASSQALTIQVSERPGAPPAPQGPPPQAPAQPAPSPQADEAPPEPTAPGPPDQYAGRQAFLWAHVPDRTLYVGEPVYVEYVLFVRAGLPVQGARAERLPDFKGFVVDQAATPEHQGRRVRVRGVPYDAYVQWRGAVTALGPGKATLDTMSVILVTGDLFSQRGYRVSSEPVVVDFQDPPATGRPADFLAGTVGAFVIRSVLDKDRIRVGDSALLTVTVSGSGNLRAVKAPDVQVPEGLRVSRVPSSDLDERMVDLGGVSGRRLFQFLLTAEREGEYEIPRMDLAYFNPVTSRYERSHTDPLRLVVAGHATGGPVREVRAPEGRIVEIVGSADLSERPEPRTMTPFPAEVVGGFLAGPVLLFLGVEAAVRHRQWRSRNHEALRRRKALSEARTALRRLARTPPEDPRDFWAGLDRVIRDFLRARFDVSADLPHEEVRAALLAREVSSDAVEVLVAEMDACAFGRFAPSAAQDQDRGASLDRVRACLAALDRARDGQGSR